MEKESSTNIICSYCSGMAESDTVPPMCARCSRLEKQADGVDRGSLRDTVENKTEELWHTME